MTATRQPPLVCVVGRSNSGKTTVIVALVEELKRRGYRIATVKHASHGFDPDHPGKDSWRHINAGADAVAVIGPQAFSIYRRQVDPPAAVDQILATLGDDFDLVLIEGYSGLKAPKIEVIGPETIELLSPPEEIIALVVRQPLALPLPQFDLGQVGDLADLLEQVVLRPLIAP